MSLRERMAGLARSMGAAAVGVADLDRVRTEQGPPAGPCSIDTVPFSRAVVIAARISDAVVERLLDGPDPLYAHHYRQANFALDRIAYAIAGVLQDEGAAALPVPASQIVVRQPMMRGELSHRLLGVYAGLGWIGRSGLLVSGRFGARARYASILTDADIPSDRPVGGGCGDCRACGEACPAGAIGEEAADLRIDDCYETLTGFCGRAYVGQHICGICLKACPPRGA